MAIQLDFRTLSLTLMLFSLVFGLGMFAYSREHAKFSGIRTMGAGYLLIGGGCVARVETSGVSLGEFGPANFFAQAVKTGAIEIRDATCPAVYTGIQAGEKGIPFMPMRGVIDSDLLANRPDWMVIDNPFAEADDPILLVPAIIPDVAAIHVAEADRFGNAWIGNRHELKTLAHAARRTLITAERIVDHNLAEDPARSPNLISALYIEAMAEVPGGAWPLACPPLYGTDTATFSAYAAASRQAARGGGAQSDWLSVITPGRQEAAE